MARANLPLGPGYRFTYQGGRMERSNQGKLYPIRRKTVSEQDNSSVAAIVKDVLIAAAIISVISFIVWSVI